MKPAYRGAWRQRRRCLILTDGFFEWQELPSGRGPKVPHWIHMADGRPFGFAGLWERWDGQGQTILSCTILTTAANALVAPIHDRMPVILGDESAWNLWVDPQVSSADLTEALAPYPSRGDARLRGDDPCEPPCERGPAVHRADQDNRLGSPHPEVHRVHVLTLKLQVVKKGDYSE